jgi:hypothetical protein
MIHLLKFGGMVASEGKMVRVVLVLRKEIREVLRKGSQLLKVEIVRPATADYSEGLVP